MLDRLIDFLLSCIRLFEFWIVVDAYQKAVVLRFGRFHRELDPGLHWMVPFGIDRALTDSVVPRTINLGPQSLTTRDGRSVVVSAVVTCRVANIKQALLEVEGVNHAVRDASFAEIAGVVLRTDWERLSHADLGEELAAACHKRARKWGIEIIRVQLSDVALSRSLRLWQEHHGAPTLGHPHEPTS